MPIRTYNIIIVAAHLGAMSDRRCARNACISCTGTRWRSRTDTANLPLRGRMFICTIDMGGSRYGDNTGIIARIIAALARLCARQRRCAGRRALGVFECCFAQCLSPWHTPRETVQRDGDRGIVSDNSKEVLDRAAVDEHCSAALRLLPAVWIGARPGLVALFSAVEALALGIIQQRLVAVSGGVLAATVAALGLALSSAWWSGR